MALVMSPWFGRGRSCGRRARPFAFGSPSLFTDLVIMKVQVPVLQRQACAPAGAGTSPATSNARVVQWAETPEAHTFKLRLPGLKKENVQIQVEDDRTLYINYSHQQPKDDSAKAGDGAASTDSQAKEQCKLTPGSSCSFKRKFKLPETADLEQIKAEVTNETLTLTVPKLKVKAAEPRRNIEISEGVAVAATSQEAKAAEKPDANKPSTSTA